MALIVCPECEKRISEFAPACPNCGCPMSIIEDILLKKMLEEEEAAELARKKKEEELEQKRILEEEKRILEEQRLKALAIEEEQKRKLAEEKYRIKKENELREYKKRMATLKVAQFDTITIAKPNNSQSKRTFRVDTKRNYGHDIFIGLKYSEIFTDKRGEKWQVLDIKKNNPYEGLDSILPGLASSDIGLVSGKGSPTYSKKPTYDVGEGLF